MVKQELNKPEIKATIKPGMTIAVGIGSRGIAEIPRIAQAVIAELKALGLFPLPFRRWEATVVRPLKVNATCWRIWG
ncbi:hypothetical protein [Budvicia aquatica]|uniref:hypothetical protein n=1 Tax=Budvicia aquatica TaxID=82979 RepID=UPI001C3F77B7|nr:hypothetical protein [Budvicia aquatica]